MVGGNTLLVFESSDQLLTGSSHQMDYFQWNLTIGFAIVTAVLAESTGENPPNVRRASMASTVVLYLAGGQILLTAIMSAMCLPCPIMLSSSPAGSTTRPGVYVLVEDVCSVDGNCGQEFRKAIQNRYEASSEFRRMIAQLSWFGGGGSLLVAIGLTVIVEVAWDLNVMYALGKILHCCLAITLNRFC